MSEVRTTENLEVKNRAGIFIKPVTSEGGVSYMPTAAGYAALIALMAVVLVIASLVAGKNEHRQISTRHLTFALRPLRWR